MALGTTQMCEVLRFGILRSHVFNTKRTHTQKKRFYANQFHHHCSFSFLLISFQEIWKVDWAEIEAREERDSDLPWVIETSILFTVTKMLTVLRRPAVSGCQLMLLFLLLFVFFFFDEKRTLQAWR